jgi:hypothetical protein
VKLENISNVFQRAEIGLGYQVKSEAEKKLRAGVFFWLSLFLIRVLELIFAT